MHETVVGHPMYLCCAIHPHFLAGCSGDHQTQMPGSQDLILGMVCKFLAMLKNHSLLSVVDTLLKECNTARGIDQEA